jgi:hypothetical protein
MADPENPVAGAVDFDEDLNLVVYDGERWTSCGHGDVPDVRTRIRNDPPSILVQD